MALTQPAAALGGAIIGGASNLIGGLTGAWGVKKQNEQNLAMAREQMRFQERMSSTAYQRAATDLEKAGLNRILALGKPATTPGGASARFESEGGPKQQAAVQMGNIAANTALQMAQAKLADRKADILGPAAEGMSAAEEGIKEFRNWFNIDRGQLKNTLRELKDKGMDAWRNFAAPTSGKNAKGSKAMTAIDRVATSLGLNNAGELPQLLIDQVRKMDLPPEITDSPQRALDWAVENIEQVQRFMMRSRNQ